MTSLPLSGARSARRLSEGVPDEFQTGGARPRASRNRTHCFDGEAADKFTYALPVFTVQRRKTGWWISPTWSAGEKPQWTGPFATIETACLSIARKLAIEIADRHTQSIERHGLTTDDLLYGLKPTTRLDAP
jgi:hypothetical protein